MRDRDCVQADAPASLDVRATRRLIDAWLAAHVEEIDPVNGTNHSDIFFRQKCFNELCMILTWRAALDEAAPQGPSTTPDLRRIAAHVDACLTPDHLDLALRSPLRVLTFTQTLAHAVNKHGATSPMGQRLAAALTGPFAWGAELLPCRQLDLLVACRTAKLAPPLDVAAVLSTSSLALAPCPILSDREAYYSFTHSVAFGSLLNGWHLPRNDLAGSAALGGLQRALADDDIDLATELALSALLLGERAEGVLAHHLHQLAAQLQRDGALYPAVRSGPLREFLGMHPDARWAVAFHAMVVAGMLFSWLEQRAIQVGAAQPRVVADELEIGSVYRLLQGYQIASALSQLELLTARGAARQRDLARITGFLSFIRRPQDGHFGCFTEERRLFEQAWPERDFDSELRAPLTSACQRFLADHAMPA